MCILSCILTYVDYTQGWNELQDVIDGVGGTPRKPPAGADHRWGGFIPMCAWVNEQSVALQEYEAPEDCVPNDDGSVFKNHAFDDNEWLENMQLVNA